LFIKANSLQEEWQKKINFRLSMTSTQQQQQKQKLESDSSQNNTTNDNNNAQNMISMDHMNSGSFDDIENSNNNNDNNDEDDGNAENNSNNNNNNDSTTTTSTSSIENDTTTTTTTNTATSVDVNRAAKLENLLTEKLLDCTSKTKVDEFCVSFCYLNSKNARKKLVQALVRIPRQRVELCSCFARIICILSQVFQDLVVPILDALRKEFYGIIKAKTQLYTENKLKNIRYHGELIKFGIAPPIVAFKMFSVFLNDFSQHNVDLLSTLLETCGRFLYLIPYTHQKMNGVLDTTLRLRRAKNLDLRQQTLLESAYFSVKPVEKRSKSKKKELSMIQLYINYLLQEKLDDKKKKNHNPDLVENVIKCLRRLPWQKKNEKIEWHIVKTVLKISRTKYTNLPNVADCISGLSRFFLFIYLLIFFFFFY
jgi:regulator of nonsense transcripts 2